MIELNDIKLIKAFQVDEYEYCNYIVYVMEDKDNYSFYLQNKYYGVIMLMWGTPKDQIDLDTFMNCYCFDEYIQEYQEEYEDIEVI